MYKKHQYWLRKKQLYCRITRIKVSSIEMHITSILIIKHKAKMHQYWLLQYINIADHAIIIIAK